MACTHNQAKAGGMRRPGVCLASAVALALLGACAELRWQKPDADAAAPGEDLQECRRLAVLEAGREALPWLVARPLIRYDARGNPFVVQAVPFDADRFRREQELTGACMRRKGYVLAPPER